MIKKFIVPLIMTLLLPVFLIILWLSLAPIVDNPMILPSFQKVFGNLTHPNQSLIGLGSLAVNILISLLRVSIGYILAILVALPLGIMMGYSKTVYQLFNNFIGLFRPIPPLAWVPLVLAWFGIASLATMVGVEQGKWYVYLGNFKLSMIFIIFIGAFYPIITSAVHAVKNVRQTLIDTGKILGASEVDIFMKILIPAAAPTMVNGLRTGLGTAWACLIAAEMLPGSLSGIGYMITHAYELARIDIVMTGMISIGLVGALLDFMFRMLEEKRYSWQQQVK